MFDAVCKGALALGSGCRNCSRCVDELAQALKPFAEAMTVDEEGKRSPFIDDTMHDSDGVDFSWEPDQPFSPFVVGQFRRAGAVFKGATK